MTIAIFGATGFLGTRLIRSILEQTDWNIKAIGRNPEKIKRLHIDDPRLSIHRGDVSSSESVTRLLIGVDVAYYFVHMMGRRDVDFYEAELAAARTFARAVQSTNNCRVVYVGGLGDNRTSQSKHLRSRHETGEILRAASDNVIELRAAMIIGRGSVAFDIIRNVVDRLSIMALPKASNTVTQPIAAADALAYLLAAATIPIQKSLAVDIGGPDIVSYADLYRAYAAFKHKHPLLLTVPYVPAFCSALFLNLMTPTIHARIGSIMAESMATDMTVQNRLADTLFPDIHPMTLHEAFETI